MTEPILKYSDVEDSGISRRRYVAIVGAIAGAPALAGCSGDDGDDGDDGGGDGGDGGNGGSDGGGSDGDGGDGSDETPTEGDGNSNLPSGPRPHFDAYADLDVSHGGTVNIVMSTSFSALDAAYSVNSADLAVTTFIAERLFELNEGLEAYPKIATGIEVSDGGKQWTFSLREGVMFHPPFERELTAEDVKFNFERIGNPDTGSVHFKTWYRNAEYTAVDDYTFRINFDEPRAAMDNWQASIDGVGMHSPDAIEERGNMKQEPVGTGPFVFEEWVQGDHLTMTAYDNYYIDGLPVVDTVEIPVIPNASTKRSSLQNGDVHILRKPVADTITQLENADGITLSSEPSDGFRTIDCNPMEEPTEGRADGTPTTDRKVRQAVNAAIGREEMAVLVKDGKATPTQNYWPERSPWHLDYNPYSMTASPDESKRLLEEAGYSTPVPVTMLGVSGRPVLQAIGRTARDQLSKAGFDVNLVEPPGGGWWSRLQSSEWDLAVNIFSGIPDPDIARPFFTAPGEDSYAFNWTVDGHEEMFSTWDEGGRVVEYEERKELYDEAQRTAIDAGCRNVVFHPWNVRAFRDEVKNYKAEAHNTNFEMDKLWVADQ